MGHYDCKICGGYTLPGRGYEMTYHANGSPCVCHKREIERMEMQEDIKKLKQRISCLEGLKHD